MESEPFARFSLAKLQRSVLMGVVPAVGTVVLMLGMYGLIGLSIFVTGAQQFSLWLGLVALVSLLVLPHFAVGFLMGYWRGVAAEPAIAVGFAPLIAMMILVIAFDGPLLELFDPLWLTLIIVLFWVAVATGGMVVGHMLSGRTRRSRPSYRSSKS